MLLQGQLDELTRPASTRVPIRSSATREETSSHTSILKSPLRRDQLQMLMSPT